MAPGSKRKRDPPTINLTEEQLEDIQLAFNVFDPKRSGTISVKDAIYAMQSLGLTSVDKQQVKDVADNNGMVHLEDFSVILAGPKLAQRQQAQRAFELFDKDGKGLICVQDLQRVAVELGETSLTEIQLQDMIQYADAEGEGLLSKADFMALAESLDI
jgi:Ca2+-binding EF-hand superfamily protein